MMNTEQESCDCFITVLLSLSCCCSQGQVWWCQLGQCCQWWFWVFVIRRWRCNGIVL